MTLDSRLAPTTPIQVGVVDVYVLRPYREEWLVLALQRSAATRSPSSWETVHGRIEPGERPEDAAVREVREESGLAVDRLYSITCQPFYLHGAGVVQMAVVFAAFVREPADVRWTRVGGLGSTARPFRRNRMLPASSRAFSRFRRRPALDARTRHAPFS